MARSSLFLPWDRPLLPQLVEHLLDSGPGHPIDLSSLLIIVPTQQASRRLRQALAIAAATHHSGVLAPRILTPDQLVASASRETVASPSDVAAGWTALLQEIQLEAFEAVFPHVPETRDANWATSLAHQLASLQTQLGEYGFDFTDVARALAVGHVEADRWTALANLENAWKAFLHAKELISPNAAKIRAAEETPAPSGISRVLVAGVIDPLPIALRVLARWADILPLEIISSGDPAVFDEWGRVREGAIEGRILPLGARATIHVARDLKAGAEMAASLAIEYKEAPRTLAIAAIHSSAIPALEVALRARQLEGHDLSGVPLGTVGLGLLATLLLESLRDPRPIFLAQLFRHPHFSAFAIKQGWTTDEAELLRALDDVINQHLPSDVDSLIAFARDHVSQRVSANAQAAFSLIDLEGAVRWVVECGRQMRRRGVAQSIRSTLVAITGARAFDLSQEQDRERAEELEQVGEILDQFAEVEKRFPSLGAEAAALVLKNALQRAHRFPAAVDAGWDLQGWLELPYEDAPHLVLVGVNEGAIPETIRGDLFLPNSLRELLGLRGNAARARRDQILLEGYLRSRQSQGRVDLIVPRASDQGEPLQASRMLFACDDRELVARAKLLFGDLPPPRVTAPRRAAWKLAPLPYTPPATFSPSKLKQYLLCPYRYYLRHILNMEAVETDKHELSATDFGNLCHFALERLGKDAAMQEIVDVHILADYLVNALDEESAKMLGRVTSFALQVQLESARARLRAAATVEAAERAEGWRIVACEQPWSLTLDTMVINGRIDRIDRNEANGMYRLIDYKTTDTGRPPEEAHWTRHRGTEAHVLPESIFTMEGKPWRWLDLQLPLYLLAMREKFGSAVAAGYFVLPKTKESTAIRLWTQLTPEHLLHAEATAQAIGAAIARGRFWPPAEKAYADDLDYLFPDGIETDVDAAAMIALAQGKAAHG